MHAFPFFLAAYSLADMLPTKKSRKSFGTGAINRTTQRRTLQDHLSAADAFARIAEHATRLHSLQTLLDVALPTYLMPSARVANLKRGKVIIHADSGAVAVKLRQLAPRLAESLIQQGQEITGIEVRVQARLPVAGIRNKQPKLIGLRPKQALTSLISGLEVESPVRLALEKLLSNT